MKIFVQLAKVDLERRLVYGRATQEIRDKSGETFDYATSKPLFEAWSAAASAATKAAGQETSYGNVRAMHGPIAAGKLVEPLAFDDVAKSIDVVAEVVDEAEWQKVKTGVYTGFSIGGVYANRWTDGAEKRFTASPAEISLVDNPCVPSATFSLVKANGVEEVAHFAKVDGATVDEEIASSVTADLVGLEKTDLEEIPADVSTVAGSGVAAAAPVVPAPVASADSAAPAASPSGSSTSAPAPAADDPALASTPAETPEVAAARAALVAAEAALAAAMDAASTAGALKMAKGMSGVSRFADLLESLGYVASNASYEALYEGDASPVPAALRAWIKTGAEIFAAMAAEESAEMLASLEALAKCAVCGLVDCSCAAKSIRAGDLAKRAIDARAEVDALAKSVEALSGERDSLATSLADLRKLYNATPEPAKGVVSAAVAKAADAVDATPATIELPNPETDPTAFSHAVMKMALNNPRRVMA